MAWRQAARDFSSLSPDSGPKIMRMDADDFLGTRRPYLSSWSLSLETVRSLALVGVKTSPAAPQILTIVISQCHCNPPFCPVVLNSALFLWLIVEPVYFSCGGKGRKMSSLGSGILRTAVWFSSNQMYCLCIHA